MMPAELIDIICDDYCNQKRQTTMTLTSPTSATPCWKRPVARMQFRNRQSTRPISLNNYGWLFLPIFLGSTRCCVRTTEIGPAGNSLTEHILKLTAMKARLRYVNSYMYICAKQVFKPNKNILSVSQNGLHKKSLKSVQLCFCYGHINTLYPDLDLHIGQGHHA